MLHKRRSPANHQSSSVLEFLRNLNQTLKELTRILAMAAPMIVVAIDFIDSIRRLTPHV